MTYALAALCGALIGLSAVLFFLLDGRIVGISGLVAGVLQRLSERWIINATFLVGLSLGSALFAVVGGEWPIVQSVASLPTLALAGLLVGFGTRLGSGCTSGHGVCGLARLSPLSLGAVMTFSQAIWRSKRACVD